MSSSTRLSRATSTLSNTSSPILGTDWIRTARVRGHGRGAFSIAVDRNHIDVVRYLLTWEKTDPNLSDSWMHHSPLLVAAISGNDEMVAVLKSCSRVDLQNPDVAGTSPLHAAVERNNISIVRTLLSGSRTADVNATDTHGQTPLFTAVLQGHSELVAVLLECGADPSLRCAEGLTALDQGLQWQPDGKATAELRNYIQMQNR
ncbi:hypothetical protein N7532_002002 [Penicillium argentinense]|uniref:Ankyrin n=1 Tax=Penicillium argentinense TaxID=1131581 RepID=A0A9W9KN08_9EURO|nr:uncharacterized protein N7532_002002 [Penicillium argentinense]KAJ5111467.1 hypothetical protein N7532_002002 [Penicillium argentinense]